MPEQPDADDLERLLLEQQGSDLASAIASRFRSLEGRIGDLQRRLATLEIYSKYAELSSRLAATAGAEPIAALGSVSVSAIEYLSARENFYEVEYSEGGQPYRWTGPERSVGFTFMLDRRSPLDLQLVIFGFVDPQRQGPLLVKVDGNAVDVSETENPQGGLLFTARIPPRPEQLNLATELEVFVRQTITPSAQDPRRLGAAFSELRIGPPVPGNTGRETPAR
jgi:hypothetical protein